MKAANTPSLLQHPFHEHALIFQELSESFHLKCKICGFSVKGGPAYHCIEYCEFFLHKSCAELPPEIQHPSHPQHPLVFSSCSSQRFRCYGCRNALRGKRYQCYDCEIHLHAGCAAATLPPPKEEEEHKDEQKHKDKDHHEEDMIEHFAHNHPLASFHVDAPNYIRCWACERRISGRVYGCRACIFVLHESCALAPREIMNHPFHPQHPLTLLADLKCKIECDLVLRDRVVDEHYDYEEQYCDVCETLRNPELGVYYGEECNYAAEIDCVIPKVDPEKSRQTEDLKLKQLDGQISREEEELEALKKKLERSMKNLEEFKKERREISSSRVQREAESDRG
ncbi:hypothetical protein CRG98_034989 [Punica granatum]|uniref:DC1 domain-containing protein n=1 Tax=Punica granatum TaxID=22663 RepID=A0A2I0IKW2_PUNGR|nr:hypothetical protein CRG98_034989 [Punica granatum]